MKLFILSLLFTTVILTHADSNTCSDIFGQASNLNVFTSGDISVGGADAAGAVAAGGNFAAPSSFTTDVYNGLTSFSLVAAGSISAGSIDVTAGNVIYGTTETGPVYFNGQGSLIHATAASALPINFPVTSAQLLALSTLWASLPATGVETSSYGTITLTCSASHPAVEVFKVAGSLFSSFNLQFSGCASSQSIIVDVSGTSVNIQSGSFDTTNVVPTNVVFNFNQATSLQISGVALPYTTLAPLAAISGSGSQVCQLFSKSLTSTSSFEFHSNINGKNCWFAGCLPTGTAATTSAPTTAAPTTKAPTTKAPTTHAPTTAAPTTQAPTTKAPTTVAATTKAPTTAAPTTKAPTTASPTTAAPTTKKPTTVAPTTVAPTTAAPTTVARTTAAPTTVAPTTVAPTTAAPTTVAPTTVAPTTVAPTTVAPTTVAPTTVAPTTVAPTTVAPTTVAPTTVAPTTVAPTTVAPTTVAPTTVAPTTVAPTTVAPSTAAPTPAAPVVPETCGTTTCPLGEYCCDDVTLGPTCYDHNIASCPNGTQGPVLCGFQEHGPDLACGIYCYDSIDYVCCGEQIYGVDDDFIPCEYTPLPANDTVVECGNQICDSAGYQCCMDVVNGPTCFWPTASSCHTGSAGTMLCGVYDALCGTVCYDPSLYACAADNSIYFIGN